MFILYQKKEDLNVKQGNSVQQQQKVVQNHTQYQHKQVQDNMQHQQTEAQHNIHIQYDITVLQPLQNVSYLDFFGQQEKFGQSKFLKKFTSMCACCFLYLLF